MRKGFTLIELLVAVVLIVIVGGVVWGMGYKLFSQKTFSGKVMACSEMSAAAVSSRSRLPAGAFSFAIDMQVPGSEEVLSFSAEDRKFANVVKGDSIRVRVFKYAPWNLDKAGTYYGGRLLNKYISK